ncbi:hypothetical protein ACWCXC_17160 [Streptomyces sp. NPDC001515]
MTTAAAMAYIVTFYGTPTAITTSLPAAQDAALAKRTRPEATDRYENHWTEHSPGHWRLMSRQAGHGGRWTWTQYAVLTAPLLPTAPVSVLPPEQPCTDPRHTGPLREQLGCSGPDPAVRRDRYAAALAAADGHEWEAIVNGYPADAEDYRREAAAVMAVADAEQQPAPAPAAPADLRDRIAQALNDADTYAQIQRRDDRERLADAVMAVLPAPADRAAVHVAAERDCLAMAVMFARQWKPDAPMSLRDGIDEILATMPSRPADEVQPEPVDIEESHEDAARRFARRLHAVEQLCAGRPGYDTVTVKAVLTAMSEADEAQQPETEELRP